MWNLDNIVEGGGTPPPKNLNQITSLLLEAALDKPR